MLQKKCFVSNVFKNQEINLATHFFGYTFFGVYDESIITLQVYLK
jgi:hypothetical protein